MDDSTLSIDIMEQACGGSKQDVDISRFRGWNYSLSELLALAEERLAGETAPAGAIAASSSTPLF